MPWMTAVVERANETFNSKNIGNVDAGLFAAGGSLLAAAKELTIVTTPREESHVAAWPQAVQESLRAALYSAVSRGVSVQFIWRPAAGFGVATWEAAGVNGSMANISVELRSPALLAT